MVNTSEAAVTITRTSQFANKMRAYRIFLDGEEAGKIKNGETKKLEVRAGTHTLELEIDGCRSERIEFMAGTGEEIRFETGSRLTGMKLLRTMHYLQEDLKNGGHNYVYLQKAQAGMPAR
ncbi:hypothetical protein V1498_20350 [Peribacillus sp. SCS-26]|uniref:hypothetical protein n=1 Tax=Paraperibacillus marinus TaxID=3115295 RepID=UPI003905BB71